MADKADNIIVALMGRFAVTFPKLFHCLTSEREKHVNCVVNIVL